MSAPSGPVPVGPFVSERQVFLDRNERGEIPRTKVLGTRTSFRLLTDPRRLWRRYLVNNPAFVWRVFLHSVGATKYDMET